MLSFDMFPESWYCLNSDADLWSSLIVDVGQIFVGLTDTFTAQITAGVQLLEPDWQRHERNDDDDKAKSNCGILELTLT